MVKARREGEGSMCLSPFMHLRLHVNSVHSNFGGITQGAKLQGQHKQVKIFPEPPGSSGTKLLCSQPAPLTQPGSAALNSLLYWGIA